MQSFSINLCPAIGSEPRSTEVTATHSSWAAEAMSIGLLGFGADGLPAPTMYLNEKPYGVHEIMGTGYLTGSLWGAFMVLH